MSEMRIDHSASSFYGGKAELRQKIDALLNTMSPEARQAILSLAKADDQTRRSVLAKLDSKTRTAMEKILEGLSAASG